MWCRGKDMAYISTIYRIWFSDIFSIIILNGKLFSVSIMDETKPKLIWFRLVLNTYISNCLYPLRGYQNKKILLARHNPDHQHPARYRSDKGGKTYRTIISVTLHRKIWSKIARLQETYCMFVILLYSVQNPKRLCRFTHMLSTQ